MIILATDVDDGRRSGSRAADLRNKTIQARCACDKGVTIRDTVVWCDSTCKLTLGTNHDGGMFSLFYCPIRQR